MTTQRIVCQIHGFLSAMNYFIFFIYVPLVHSELYMLMTTYSNGQTVAGTPEIYLNTTLVRQQIDYYDSEIKKLIPKQDWMKKFASTETWKNYTEIRERVQQTNKLDISVLMEQFNQTHGAHTYQRVYGCYWDDETGVSSGFDEHGYDGQRFISLDLKKIRYTASVPQAQLTVMKWNNDREQLNILKQYYRIQCVTWLKELLYFSKTIHKKTGIVPELTGQSLKEPTQKNRSENDNKSDGSASYASYILAAVFVLFIFVVLLIYFNRKALKQYCNKIYYKDVQSDEQNSISEPSDSKFFTRGRIFTVIPNIQDI